MKNIIKKTALFAAAMSFVAAAPTKLIAGATFEGVKARGQLLCGTRNDVQGFAYLDGQGKNVGFEIAFCEAIAAAVLGDKTKVEYVIVGTADRLDVLKAGKVDVLFGTTTWTYSRDTGGFDFGGVNFYDSQGFLVRRSLGIRSILSVPAGTKVCVARGTTTAVNLVEYSKKHNFEIKMLELESPQAARQAFYADQCEVYTNDRSLLAVSRASEAVNRDDYILLADAISKEPLGLVVRQEDAQWTDIVRWVLYATIEAEERGMTSKNVRAMADSSDPAVRFILGISPGVGAIAGLDDQWVLRVVEQVGNYGEIFERHLGLESELQMPRGINDLWSRGGLLYSPPLR